MSTFRFVVVARVADQDAGLRLITDSAHTCGGGVFEHHAGVYEVVHEHGAPDGAQGVLLISPFEVAADADERFLAAWEPASRVLAGQPGYQGTRLYRSLDAHAGLRCVETTRWSSPLAFALAMGRPELRVAMEAVPFEAHPALYLPVPDP